MSTTHTNSKDDHFWIPSRKNDIQWQIHNRDKLTNTLLGSKMKTHAHKNTKACQPCQQALYYIRGSQKMINTKDGQEPRIGAISF